MINFIKYHCFDYEKIIQLLAYIQRQTESTDKLTLLKLLFFIDRIHLRRYFSLISHDIYYALRTGPVASKTLSVLNRSNYLESDILDKNKEFLSKIEILNTTEWLIKETKTDCLSNNVIKVVDMIVDLFGSFSLSTLIDITHDYPEWKRWEYLFKEDLTDGELIDSDDFFKNPVLENSPALQKYFNGKDPLYEEEDYLDEAKRFYNDYAKLRYDFCLS